MEKSDTNRNAKTYKLTDNISITVNFEEESAVAEYNSFCDKLKKCNSLNELSERERLKLFLLAGLMTPSSLRNLIKDKSGIVIPSEYGTLTLRGLGSCDSLTVKGNGEEIWNRDNRIVSELSLCDLSLRLSDEQRFNHDFVYNFLMNFGSRMKWTQNPKVAEIFSSCVSDVTEKLCKDKFTDMITLRYVGHIDWLRLKNMIKENFGASIKTRKSGNSDIWNVYINTLESIFITDIKEIVHYRKAILNGEWVENSLQLLVDEVNQKYDINVKTWQIKGMIRKPVSSKNLSDVLTELVRSKRLIYPILQD